MDSWWLTDSIHYQKSPKANVSWRRHTRTQHFVTWSQQRSPPGCGGAHCSQSIKLYLCAASTLRTHYWAAAGVYC